jgi:hypothetical protein
MNPFRFVLIAVAGWMNQRQLQAIDYLKEENRVLASQTDRGEVRWERQAEAGAAAYCRRDRNSGGAHGRREPGWGYRRIQGALSNLGHEVARSTIAAILQRHGMEPAPERGRNTTWKEFLRQHWELIVAADFFTIEAWTRRGLLPGQGLSDP